MINGYDIVYNWFDHLGNNINKEIGAGKRFMVYEMIKRIKQQSANDILLKLQQGVNSSDRRRDKLCEVWEDSFDWKECISHKFIVQKLDYMHNNPCSGKWMLAKSPVDYKHSSAAFYINNEPGRYRVTNYMELEDIDLTKGGNSNTGIGESRADAGNRRF